MTVKALDAPSGPETVQLKTPVFGSMTAPAGAPAPRLKVRVFVGTSGSVAVTVNVTVVPMAFVRFAIAASTGGLLTSLTVTVKLRVALAPLASVTRTVKVFVLGLWASVGVQVTTPVELIAAPSGASLKAKVNAPPRDPSRKWLRSVPRHPPTQ